MTPTAASFPGARLMYTNLESTRQEACAGRHAVGATLSASASSAERGFGCRGVLHAAGPHQRAQELLVVVGRSRRLDEALDDVDEAVGVVVERHVAGVFEDFQL